MKFNLPLHYSTLSNFFPIVHSFSNTPERVRQFSITNHSSQSFFFPKIFHCRVIFKFFFSFITFCAHESSSCAPFYESHMFVRRSKQIEKKSREKLLHFTMCEEDYKLMMNIYVLIEIRLRRVHRQSPCFGDKPSVSSGCCLLGNRLQTAATSHI